MGWGGAITLNCICTETQTQTDTHAHTHTSCYATGRSLGLAQWSGAIMLNCTCTGTHIHIMLRYWMFACTYTHTRHATLLEVLLHLRAHTHVMLRCWTFSCACTHTHTRCATLLDVLLHLHTHTVYIRQHLSSCSLLSMEVEKPDDLWWLVGSHFAGLRASWTTQTQLEVTAIRNFMRWQQSTSASHKSKNDGTRVADPSLETSFSTKDYCFVLARIIFWHNNADSKHSAGINMPICTQYANMQRLSELTINITNLYML